MESPFMCSPQNHLCRSQYNVINSLYVLVNDGIDFFGLGNSLFEITPPPPSPPLCQTGERGEKKCPWLVAKSLSFIPLEGHSNDWVKALNLRLGEKALRHQLLHSDLL